MPAAEDSKVERRRAELKRLAKVGEVVADKYVVERIVGVGGLGVVAAARHRELDQQVAIKFLQPRPHDWREATKRFAREGRIIASLKSEHVPRVFDVGKRVDGVPYMVMEFLEGESLGRRLRQQGPLGIADAVGYLLQACEGVAEAHSHGVIHRDIKPENLFVAQDRNGADLIKVLDFGVSKAPPLPSEDSDHITRTSVTVGSPFYASPEQLLSARSVDVRSDVWALGVTLF